MGNCKLCGTEKPHPDLNYNFLIKVEEQKDGLDIYKPQSILNYASQIKCPLCRYPLSDEEYSIIQDKLTFGEGYNLSNLISKYNIEAEAEYTIDNINELEILYNKIKGCVKIMEDNRYYKHICTNNEQCQRKDNQEIYIELFEPRSLENIEKNLFVDINRLKTDENYKNNYLKRKAIAHDIYMKKQRKLQIEEKYRPDFEEKTFRKEQYIYERISMMIKQIHEDDLEKQKFNSTNINFIKPLHMNADATQIYITHVPDFRYSGTKKKWKRFIEELKGQKIYEIVAMENWELEEFHKFILEREPDYYELMNIK